jgi:hypothetical protein
MVVASTGFSKSLVTSVNAMSCTSMNEVNNPGRSFFLYSNGVVYPTMTMFPQEIHVSPLNGWSSSRVVLLSL